MAVEPDSAEARAHWESHLTPPVADNGFRMTWYIHLAGDDLKRKASGTVATFLASAMSDYWHPDLPLPQIGVIQQFIDQGQLEQGMGSGFEWQRFEVKPEVYQHVRELLLDDGLVAAGTDPEWVNSLFFRSTERAAARRGTDAHHEIWRMSVTRELARTVVNTPGLSREALDVLNRRRHEVSTHDPNTPVDPFA